MAWQIDEFFALLPEAIEGYIDCDRAQERMRVRADDGRIVTVQLHPHIVRDALSKPTYDPWEGMFDWSPLRRWMALMSIHLDESINTLDTSTEYVQRAGWFDPVTAGPTPDAEEEPRFEPTFQARMGNRIFDVNGPGILSADAP
ncbi:hypothetical protein MN032_05685 [Agromyces atrinae]|uniref:hypothetical protein n=1 Tax=Agromyces atrinae TaxID=592376 RepID=UPI001F5709D0|nr:hypothetical protein [Agromyces atrinae]MCI2957176.1 hypothetical protein [Agromyces atrinae]